ncbi:MAG: glycosyltransferase family 9 protein, partial [Nitrospirales bacterium]
GNLLVACGEIGSAISLEGRFLSDLYCSPDQWSSQTHKIISCCTHVFGWLNDADQQVVQNLQAFGVILGCMQSPNDMSLSSRHIEDRYVETFQEWLHNDIIVSDRLRILDDSSDTSGPQLAGSTLAPYRQRIVIHPGSGSRHKCTESVFLASVMSKLLQEDREFLILEGPADEEAVEGLCTKLPSKIYRVLRGQSLTMIAQYFANIDLYIGHDSGPTHLAVACGVSTMALFGPTDPTQWASRSNHVAVIQGEPCQCKGWTQVQTCYSKPCLRISVERVVQKAEECLSSSIMKTGHSMTPTLA